MRVSRDGDNVKKTGFWVVAYKHHCIGMARIVNKVSAEEHRVDALAAAYRPRNRACACKIQRNCDQQRKNKQDIMRSF